MEYALILSMAGNMFLLFALIKHRMALRQSKAARDMYLDMLDDVFVLLRDATENSIRRDPKTGRYMKKGR